MDKCCAEIDTSKEEKKIEHGETIVSGECRIMATNQIRYKNHKTEKRKYNGSQITTGGLRFSNLYYETRTKRGYL